MYLQESRHNVESSNNCEVDAQGVDLVSEAISRTIQSVQNTAEQKVERRERQTGEDASKSAQKHVHIVHPIRIAEHLDV